MTIALCSATNNIKQRQKRGDTYFCVLPHQKVCERLLYLGHANMSTTLCHQFFTNIAIFTEPYQAKRRIIDKYVKGSLMLDKLKELLDHVADWLGRLLPEPTLEPVPVPVPVDAPRRAR